MVEGFGFHPEPPSPSTQTEEAQKDEPSLRDMSGSLPIGSIVVPFWTTLL